MNFFNRRKAEKIESDKVEEVEILKVEENSPKEYDLDLVFNEGIEHFSTAQAKSLNLLQRGIKTKEEFKKDVERYFINKRVSKEDATNLLERFMKFIDGYHILEELINDDSISDIKVLSDKNVRIKRYGKRETSNIKFADKAEVRRFINLVAVKNKVNISYLNAIQKFTDKDSNDKSRLRFNISTEYVNSVDNPYMHIRKISKVKPTKEEMINKGMLSKEQMDYLTDKVKNGQFILFVGKGGSGKTTLMNILIEEIDHNKSGLFIQENEELFSDTHPDMMFQHIVENNGEGKIQYTLKDLAKNGLLIDLDYFGIGEIKSGEAIYILLATNTGHQCMSSLHSNSSIEAMDKLIDYMKWDSSYTEEALKKMFRYMDTTICFMKDFTVNEISNITGYDEVKKDFIYDRIY